MGAAAFTHPGHLFAVVVVIYAANHPLCEINLLNFKTDFSISLLFGYPNGIAV